MVGAGLGFEGGEAGGVAEVRGDRHRAGVAEADQLGVDQRVADPHVREQAPVAIARLDVELEPDDAAPDQCGIQARGAAASASARAARPTAAGLMRDLGRVDADVAHALDARADPHVDGVAVVDVHDHADEAPHPLRRRRARRGERQQDRQERAREDRRPR